MDSDRTELERALDVCMKIEQLMDEALLKPAWPIDACVSARALAGSEAALIGALLSNDRPSDLQVRYVRETQGVEVAKRLLGGAAAPASESASCPTTPRRRSP